MAGGVRVRRHPPEGVVCLRQRRVLGEPRHEGEEIADVAPLDRAQRRPALDQRRRLPDRLATGPFEPSARIPRAQDAVDHRAGAPRRLEEMPQAGRVPRPEGPRRRGELLDRHQTAWLHDPAEFPQGGGQLAVGQILRHIGEPDGIEVAIREGQRGHIADARFHRAGELPRRRAFAHGGDVVLGQVERDERAGRADRPGDEREEPAAAAAGIEDVPARPQADRAEHRLVFGATRREMRVEPLRPGQRVTARRGKGPRRVIVCGDHLIPSFAAVFPLCGCSPVPA